MTVNPTVCVVISHKFYNKTKPLFENAFCKTNQIKQQNVTFTHRREHNCRKATICLSYSQVYNADKQKYFSKHEFSM